jgi:uroporphyrinogen-III synthase
MKPATRCISLGGVGVVLTRPASQGEKIAALIREAGGAPVDFPTIEIADVADPDPLNAIVDRLEGFDLAIFISQNAAEKGMRAILDRRALPTGLKFAAVGPSTARGLYRHGAPDVALPASGFDSEALLDLAQLRDVRGTRIVIFRGRGGRETLAQRLLERGASVEYAECYQRQLPEHDPGPLLQEWQAGKIQAVNLMSAEAMNNLLTLLGDSGAALARRATLFVPHPRVGKHARGLGFEDVVVTGIGDELLLTALIERYGKLTSL